MLAFRLKYCGNEDHDMKSFKTNFQHHCVSFFRFRLVLAYITITIYNNNNIISVKNLAYRNVIIDYKEQHYRNIIIDDKNNYFLFKILRSV